MMKLLTFFVAALGLLAAGCGDSAKEHDHDYDHEQEANAPTPVDTGVPTPDLNALEFVFVPADVKSAFLRLDGLVQDARPSGTELAKEILALKPGGNETWTVTGQHGGKPVELEVSVVRDAETLQITFNSKDEKLRDAIDQGILPNTDDSGGL